MVDRLLGPTLGGWLTDIVSWRWTFYINVPVGALSLLLASQFVPDTQKKHYLELHSDAAARADFTEE